MKFAWFACLAACSDASAVDHPAPPPTKPRAPAPAPELRWNGDDLTFEERVRRYDGRQPRLTAKLRKGPPEDPLRLHLAWFDFPASSTVGFGEHRVQTSSSGTGEITATLPDQASLRIDAGKVRVSKLPLEITLHGHQPATTQLPPLWIDGVLTEMYRRVADGPIRFPGEQADPHVDTAVMVGVGFSSEYHGKGKTLGELDWVVFAIDEPTGKVRKCSGYLGKHSTIEVTYFEKRVVVHDRRTGEVVAKATIAPASGCPASVLERDGKASEAPPFEAPKKWVRAQLAKRSR
jgi:hypothetical protein